MSDLIKHMVDRFLAWKLPQSFNPDGGVSFTKVANEGTPYARKYEPIGTNLFDAVQAEAMVRHMLGDARETVSRPAMQDWVCSLSIMQQSVLLGAIRGPDGTPKYHGVKFLVRWYRRCVLLSAIGRVVLAMPSQPGGGSFTGPSYKRTETSRPWPDEMDDIVSDYLRSVDELPHHYQMHFMHAVEIVGYKHPDLFVRAWWHKTYLRLVHDFHLFPESEADLDARLSDNEDTWKARADIATQA
jgi:hypothetical protein